MKKIAFTFALIFAVSLGFAQNTTNEIICHFTKAPDGKVLQVQPNGQKTCIFEVSGLNTQAAADNFLTIIKSKKGVITFTVGALSAKNMRTANILLFADAKLPFFKDMLLAANVNSVTIDGVKKLTRELGAEKKSR
jgi:hypothetical protein